jgi:hypothetical protein
LIFIQEKAFSGIDVFKIAMLNKELRLMIKMHYFPMNLTDLSRFHTFGKFMNVV